MRGISDALIKEYNEVFDTAQERLVASHRMLMGVECPKCRTATPRVAVLKSINGGDYVCFRCIPDNVLKDAVTADLMIARDFLATDRVWHSGVFYAYLKRLEGT